MPLPPEVDDAISPRSTLRPPRKSFAFALRTAAVPPGRCIGTRKCRNVKPLRLRDTALATLIRYLLRLRFCTPLPRCYTLFQRLALLSDTSLVQSAYKAETSRSVLHCEQDSYCHRLLSHIAVHSHCSPAAERICRQWNTSANILRFALHGGQRHGSTSSNRSGSEQEIVPTS